VQTARGVPVEVPFYDRPGSVEDLLAPHLTERTVALYVNTPNNPTGRVLDADTVAALAHFARQRDLWLWSDDVYEDFAFTRPHVPVAPHAPERSFTACSFSKAYGMAGNRVGYVVGPEGEVMQALRKISTHSFYSAPTAAQLAAAHVLEHGAPWLERASQLYRQSGEAAAARLGLDPPQGGTFLFLDVSAHLDERGLLGFLERCMDRKLLIAPGSSCGTDYPGHVRLCFTSAPPEAVRAGVEVLAELLGIPSSS